MFDWKKFVTVGENGDVSFDEKGFKSAYDSDFNKALDTKENNLREKIKIELENEAKLSAEEKLKVEREKLEADKIKAKIEINREKAKAKMEGKFTEKEIDRHLKLINENPDSLKDIDDIIAEKKAYEEQLETTFKEKYAITQPQPNVENTNGNNDISQPKLRSREDISKFYE